jgi:hypothetical protein
LVAASPLRPALRAFDLALLLSPVFPILKMTFTTERFIAFAINSVSNVPASRRLPRSSAQGLQHLTFEVTAKPVGHCREITTGMSAPPIVCLRTEYKAPAKNRPVKPGLCACATKRCRAYRGRHETSGR